MLTALSLIIATQFGIGYPCIRWSLKASVPLLERVGLALGMGLLVGLLAGLLTPSLRRLFDAGPLLAIPGLLLFCRDQRRERWPADWIALGLVVLAAGALLTQTLAEPLREWDARSIWFFHGKVAWHTDRLLVAQVWQDRSVSWSHPDYPKLNACWAALWMQAFPAWNEYLPKVVGVLLVLPALCLCLAFSSSYLARLALIAAFLLRSGDLLWNGYMDGCLAAYTGLAVLYGGRYASRGAQSDAAAAIVAAGLCASLKNEGAALAAIVVATTLLCRLAMTRHTAWAERLRPSYGTVLTAISASLPFFTWTLWKAHVGLGNDLFSDGNSNQRLLQRLTDHESLGAIWEHLLPGNERRSLSWLGALMVVMLAAHLWTSRVTLRYQLAAIFPAMGTAAVYSVLLTAIYLSTPYGLDWHLATSAPRTVLPVYSCIAAAMIAADPLPLTAVIRRLLPRPLQRVAEASSPPSKVG